VDRITPRRKEQALILLLLLRGGPPEIAYAMAAPSVASEDSRPVVPPQVRAGCEIKSLRRIEVHPVFPDQAAWLRHTGRMDRIPPSMFLSFG
jgi:hypothetical protein